MSSSTGGSSITIENGALAPCAAGSSLPQPRVQEQGAGVLLVGTRPLDAAELLEPFPAHAGVHRAERTQLLPCAERGDVAPVGAHALRELGDDPDVVLGVARRLERLAHPLHAALGVRHRPFRFERAVRRREHHVGELGRPRHEQVLDDQGVEAPQQHLRVLLVGLAAGGVLADHVDGGELATIHRLEHLGQRVAVRARVIGTPQAASNFARAASSFSMSWKPGSLLGIAPMSPPPCTLFWPRSGLTPLP